MSVRLPDYAPGAKRSRQPSARDRSCSETSARERPRHPGLRALAVAVVLVAALAPLLAAGEDSAESNGGAAREAQRSPPEASNDQDVRLDDAPEIDVTAERSRRADVDESAPTASTSRVELGSHEKASADLGRALGRAPGVTLRRTGSAGSPVTASLRGSAADQIVVRLGGLPLTPPGGGTVDLSAIPPSLLDGLLVTRGTEAAVHGAGALGGVILLEPLSPDHDAPDSERSLTIRGDTMHSAGSAASWRGREGDVRAAAAIDVHASRGRFRYERVLTPNLPESAPMTLTRENNEARLGSALLSAEVPAPKGLLRLVAFGHRKREGLAGMVGFPTPGATNEATRTLLGGAFESEPSGPLAAKVLASAWTAGELYDYDPGHDPSPAAGTPFDSSRQVIGVNASVEALVAGTAVRVAAEAAMESVTSASGAAGRPGGSLTISDTAFLFDDRLTLHGAARLDAFGGHPAAVSPRAGLQLSMPASISITANAGRGVRMPSLFELHGETALIAGNEELRPESAITFDGGVEIAGDLGRARLVAWRSRYRDLITYELYPPLRLRPMNVEGAVSRGVEAEGELALTSWASLAGAYTLTDSVNLSPHANLHGRALAHRPRHRGLLQCVTRLGRVELRADIEAQSAFARNRSNTRTMPARLLLGAGASVAITRSVSADVLLTNLMDDRRLEDLFGYPLPGRAAFFALRLAD